jgi:hypothetical protein
VNLFRDWKGWLVDNLPWNGRKEVGSFPISAQLLECELSGVLSFSNRRSLKNLCIIHDKCRVFLYSDCDERGFEKQLREYFGLRDIKKNMLQNSDGSYYSFDVDLHELKDGISRLKDGEFLAATRRRQEALKIALKGEMGRVMLWWKSRGVTNGA